MQIQVIYGVTKDTRAALHAVPASFDTIAWALQRRAAAKLLGMWFEVQTMTVKEDPE